jgi:hypothetical protein
MKKYTLILLIGLCSAVQLKAQVVTIKEQKNNNETVAIKAPYIVDINATLHIEVDKSVLLDSLISMLGQQQYPSELLAVINNTIRQQQKIMTDIMMTGDRRKRLASLQNFRSSMIALLSPLVANQATLQNTPLYQAANDALGTNDYSKLFDALNTQYQKINQEYVTKVNASTAYMSLGGWINTADGSTQIHLDSFDSVTNGQFYQVKRIMTSVPQSEIDAYNSAQNLADSLQSNADTLVYLMKSRFQAGVSDLEGKVDSIIMGGVSRFEAQLDSVATPIKNKFSGPVSTFKQHLNNFKTDAIKVVGEVENFSFGYTVILYNQVRSLITQADTLEAEAKVLLKMVRAEIQTAPSVAKSLASELTADISSVITQLEALGKSYLVELENTLNMFDQNKLSALTESAAQFSASTFKLPYNSIPAQTQLDLRYTGQRKAGDELYFKAEIAKDSAGVVSDKKSIYWQKVTMFQVGIYNTIRASLIFADKVNGDFANSSNDFQLAPSYSVVFKLGTRRGMFYNKYLTPGIGLNIATFDFENNNKPEIGLGLTASFFQDYLQAGYGRNMSTDDNYWFFGLRLPLFGWATGTTTLSPGSD